MTRRRTRKAPGDRKRKWTEVDYTRREARAALKRDGFVFPCFACGGRGWVPFQTGVPIREWPRRCTMCAGPGLLVVARVARLAGVDRHVVDEVIVGGRLTDGVVRPRVKPSPVFAEAALKLCAWAADASEEAA